MFFKVSEDGAWLILVDIISRSGIPLNEFTIFDFTMLLHHKVAQEVEKIFVPVADAKNPAGYHLEQQPILFPHRIINYIFNDVGLRIDERDIHQFWDNATAVGEPHVNESSRNKIPLGLYGDSAQLITKIRTEKLMCLWLNIPIFRPKAVRYSRFLMWCCDTSKLFGYRTTNSVLRWLTWSLNSLYDGVNPGRRPGNRPLSSEEEKRAGTPFLHSFQVVECRGDWEFHKFLWNFRSSWKGIHTRFRCPAVSKNLGDPSMLYWDTSENSSWSLQQYSTIDFINKQLPSHNICHSA